MERRLTKVFMIAFVALLLAARPARTSGTAKGKFEPYVFGVTSGNVGCVILKQHTAIKKKWLAAGVLARHCAAIAHQISSTSKARNLA